MLVDVAHLKVSAISILTNFFKKFIKWYLLTSKNECMKDTNNKIKFDSWFWPYLKKDLDYYSIEVYGEGPKELLKQRDLAREMIYTSNVKYKKFND